MTDWFQTPEGSEVRVKVYPEYHVFQIFVKFPNEIIISLIQNDRKMVPAWEIEAIFPDRIMSQEWYQKFRPVLRGFMGKKMDLAELTDALEKISQFVVEDL